MVKCIIDRTCIKVEEPEEIRFRSFSSIFMLNISEDEPAVLSSEWSVVHLQMSIYTDNIINKPQDKQNIFNKNVYEHNRNKMITQ